MALPGHWALIAVRSPPYQVSRTGMAAYPVTFARNSGSPAVSVMYHYIPNESLAYGSTAPVCLSSLTIERTRMGAPDRKLRTVGDAHVAEIRDESRNRGR